MQNNAGKTALGLDANLGAMLCYVANIIPCVVPLGLVYSIIVIVQDKTNKVPRFHAFQSLFLAVLGFVIAIPIWIAAFVGAFIDTSIGFPLVSLLIGLVAIVFAIAMLYFVIMAAIKGFGGQIYKIPVIGNFAEKYANG